MTASEAPGTTRCQAEERRRPSRNGEPAGMGAPGDVGRRRRIRGRPVSPGDNAALRREPDDGRHWPRRRIRAVDGEALRADARGRHRRPAPRDGQLLGLTSLRTWCSPSSSIVEVCRSPKMSRRTGSAPSAGRGTPVITALPPASIGSPSGTIPWMSPMSWYQEIRTMAPAIGPSVGVGPVDGHDGVERRHRGLGIGGQPGPAPPATSSTARYERDRPDAASTCVPRRSPPKVPSQD